MAWRIDEQVVRGEFDNRVNGKVTGTIWLAEREEPLRLELEGNPWRDWAGCVLRFTHASPKAGDLTGLTPEQIGICGDMTASRKARLPPEPVAAWLAQGAPGKESLPWGNAVYLEWVSESNGRVVIESTHYEVEITERAWSMTEEQEASQRQSNLEAMNQFMVRLQTAMEQAAAAAAAAEGAARKHEEPEADLQAEEREADRALELIFEIEELKKKSCELAGGVMMDGAGEQIVPLDVQHQFWQNVVAFESAPRKTRREILAEVGFQTPAPDSLSDQEITTHLWRLIEALAARRIFLDSTDHLSDRDLYTLLLERVLAEETEVLPPNSEWNCHICIHEYGAPGDEDGTGLYLRYYADEETRELWAADFHEEIPPHCDPPYDRDRNMPK